MNVFLVYVSVTQGFVVVCFCSFQFFSECVGCITGVGWVLVFKKKNRKQNLLLTVFI